ncbi:exodeoxyribonuclease VII small subunit [Protofrankia symbiont of Coriaria ruscifolia]|uniref:exodeoxyribonuclease VII small subunit n=1 Tax=Protofrankia symbiont of Coriaria ruscifolia TaxID=1306542 RepID=UPI0010418945|nr:exodeoxyribonuclease VII small subunit [Protofrankia symbiont of Coriaria ruscifolia]
MSGSNDTPGHQTPPVHQTPPTYERARSELEEVVHRLETGGVTLEESLSLWERGEALAKVCQAFLAGARARLDSTPVDSAGADAAEDPAR